MRRQAAVLVLLTIIGTACVAARAGDGTQGKAKYDLSAFVAALRSQGATVKLGQAITEPFFSARGRSLTVNGQDVQVLQFANAQEASQAAGAVSPDGYSVGATSGKQTTVSQIEWVATPHFFRRGRLIVLYVGANRDVLGLLRRLLGTQFAGGKPS
jgi:hypothetical protein